MVLPDRGAVTMAVPFMRSYCELLVKTCHRRGAFAMGGMAAFIPSRRDAEVNAVALAKVREDKEREASQGFDGTWVAHPDLVPTAYEAFDAVLGDAAQPDRPATRRRHGHGRRSPRHRGHARRGDRGRAAQQRLGRDPVSRRLAPGLGRRRDQQPDGGRRDGRDQPLPDLAVAPPRPLHGRRRPPHHRRGDGARSAPATTRPAPSSRASPRGPTTSSSSRSPPTTASSRSTPDPASRSRRGVCATAASAGTRGIGSAACERSSSEDLRASASPLRVSREPPAGTS